MVEICTRVRKWENDTCETIPGTGEGGIKENDGGE
jgi:hypothetical protein